MHEFSHCTDMAELGLISAFDRQAGRAGGVQAHNEGVTYLLVRVCHYRPCGVLASATVDVGGSDSGMAPESILVWSGSSEWRGADVSADERATSSAWLEPTGPDRDDKH